MKLIVLNVLLKQSILRHRTLAAGVHILAGDFAGPLSAQQHAD